MNKQVTIIIPTLNEEPTLWNTIQSLDRDCEIIVVDGGSSDNTLELAAQANCTTLMSPPGRGRQMNLGAQHASGRLLLFLHADTILPPRHSSLIKQTLDDSEVALGAFSLGFNSTKKRMRFIAWSANLRSRYFQMPYGDQGLFTTNVRFHSIGGFPEIDIMEDYAFVKRMQSEGKINILPENVVTSSRRWENMGVLRTTLINQIIVCGFKLGFSPAQLSKMYRRLRGVTPKPR